MLLVDISVVRVSQFLESFGTSCTCPFRKIVLVACAVIIAAEVFRGVAQRCINYLLGQTDPSCCALASKNALLVVLVTVPLSLKLFNFVNGRRSKEKK